MKLELAFRSRRPGPGITSASPSRHTSRSWPEALQKLIASRYGGRDLPVTLVLAGRRPRAVVADARGRVIARTWRAWGARVAGARAALARAYVHDDLDFTGSARRDARRSPRRWSATIAHGRERCAARLAAVRASASRQPRATSRTTTTSRTRSTGSGSTRGWCTRARISARTSDTLDDAQAQKLDHICRKLRLDAGRALSRHRLRLGRADLLGGGALWRRGDRHHAVAATSSSMCSAQIAARGLDGPRAGRAAATISTCPTTGVYDKIASVGHVRARRRRGNYDRYFGKIQRILKPGRVRAEPRHHAQRARRSEASAAASASSSRSTCSRAASSRTCRRVIEGLAAQGLEVIDAEALREHYAQTLWHWVDRLEANADAARKEVGEERFRVWRIYMAGSAHAFDRGWMSLWQLLAGKPLADGRLPHPLTRDYMYADPGRRVRVGSDDSGRAVGPRSRLHPRRHRPHIDRIAAGTYLPAWSRAMNLPTPAPVAAQVARSNFPARSRSRSWVVRRRASRRRSPKSWCRHAPDFDPATLEMRTSSAGNYLSLTATVNATSREQLDDLYRELVVAADGGDGAVIDGRCVRVVSSPATAGALRWAAPTTRRRGGRCRRSPTTRTPATRDEIWLTEHPPVYTLGSRAVASTCCATTAFRSSRSTAAGRSRITVRASSSRTCCSICAARSSACAQMVRRIEAAVITWLASLRHRSLRQAVGPGVYVPRRRRRGEDRCAGPQGPQRLHVPRRRGQHRHGPLPFRRHRSRAAIRGSPSRSSPTSASTRTVRRGRRRARAGSRARSGRGARMTTTVDIAGIDAAPANAAGVKHKGAAKTARIPIKVVAAERLKKPDWIRVRAPSSPRFYEIKQILREHKLHTVCEEASCPNIGECFGKGTATFMIMGDICTRRCPFCDVGHGRPLPLDAEEPVNLAKTIAALELALRRHHERRPRRPARRRRAAFRRLHPRACASTRRRRGSRCSCPISAAGSTARSTMLSQAPPDVMNHNLETVPRLYKAGAAGLRLRAFAAPAAALQGARSPDVPTKIGLMVGLGETDDEILGDDARHARARHRHADDRPVPAADRRSICRCCATCIRTRSRCSSARPRAMGFRHAAVGALVRSSYHADQQAEERPRRRLNRRWPPTHGGFDLRCTEFGRRRRQ